MFVWNSIQFKNMDPKLPKKRGRKPKNPPETLISTKPGKLNLSVVDDDSPTPTTNTNSQSTHNQKSPQNQQSTQNQQPNNPDTILTLNVSIDNSTRQSLDRFPAFESRPGYFGLLKDFSEVYPNKTDILCWWCCYEFDTHPIGVPLKYDSVNDVFKVIGCFCSFNCAYAHIKKEKLKVPLSDLKFMYEKLSGAEFSSDSWTVVPAPEKYILQRFGGPLSIQEYRSSFNNRFDIMYTPMIPFGMLCDEILGKSMNRGWTKDGISKPLEIRKAKKEKVSIEKKPVEKKIMQRTTVTQLISFN